MWSLFLFGNEKVWDLGGIQAWRDSRGVNWVLWNALGFGIRWALSPSITESSRKNMPLGSQIKRTSVRIWPRLRGWPTWSWNVTDFLRWVKGSNRLPSLSLLELDKTVGMVTAFMAYFWVVFFFFLKVLVLYCDKNWNQHCLFPMGQWKITCEPLLIKLYRSIVAIIHPLQ